MSYRSMYKLNVSCGSVEDPAVPPSEALLLLSAILECPLRGISDEDRQLGRVSHDNKHESNKTFARQQEIQSTLVVLIKKDDWTSDTMD